MQILYIYYLGHLFLLHHKGIIYVQNQHLRGVLKAASSTISASHTLSQPSPPI